ncbi:MAG: GGDEF domain-containing protein, partial [Pseudomonadota bacterium]
MGIMGAISPLGSEADVPSETLVGLDTGEIDDLARDRRNLRDWPGAIKALYREEIVQRFYREEHFLFLLGLLICLSTIVIDLIVNPAMVKEGAILRVLAVAPITMLGLIAGARKWPKMLAFCVGASPIAFTAVIVHLAVHLPPDNSARYLAATALVVGLANIILPYTIRGLVIFDFAFIAVAAATLAIWHPQFFMAHLDYFVVLAVVGGATLPLALRFEKLRQHNFLLTLRARVASERLIKANARLRDLSERDPLTGMPNRRHFEAMFDHKVMKPRVAGTDVLSDADAAPDSIG